MPSKQPQNTQELSSLYAECIKSPDERISLKQLTDDCLIIDSYSGSEFEAVYSSAISLAGINSFFSYFLLDLRFKGN